MLENKIIKMGNCPCCEHCNCCPCIAGFVLKIVHPSCCEGSITIPLMGHHQNGPNNECEFVGAEGKALMCEDDPSTYDVSYRLYCDQGILHLHVKLEYFRNYMGSSANQTIAYFDRVLDGCNYDDLNIKDAPPDECTNTFSEFDCMCEGIKFTVTPVYDTMTPECQQCQLVTGLRSTGTVDTAAGLVTDPDGVKCMTDKYWKANGGPAFIVSENFPYGCSGQSWIGDRCDATAPNAGTNGGPDGEEIVFKSSFFIGATADLKLIKLSGRYAADNYVKAGCWKINGHDQCQIYHGTYNNRTAIDCVDFEIDHSHGQFVHGENTVEITVKNGHHASAPGYGGQQPFSLQWACFNMSEAPPPASPGDCVTEVVDP